MKKIGILTYHRAINYGAFLQCYSLTTYIQGLFPEYKVEVIDFETRDEYVIRIKQLLKSKSISELFQRIKMRIRFKEDRKKYLPLSSKRCVSNIPGKLSEVFSNDYDAIIVGSDAVWHRVNYNFFLKGLKCKKFSYAASTSGLSTEKLGELERKELQNLLTDFLFIGVREEKSERFIASLDIPQGAFHTCDPTCFLDVDRLKVDFTDKFKRYRIEREKPIVCLMTANEIVGKVVWENFHSTHQIVSIYASNKYADIMLWDLSPMEFATFFSHVDILFSYFFHGCYLCMKNGTPAIAVDEDSETDGNRTKIKYLFDRLGISDRYFRPKEMNKKQFQDMVEKAKELIGTNQRKFILDKLAEESESRIAFTESICNSLNAG